MLRRFALLALATGMVAATAPIPAGAPVASERTRGTVSAPTAADAAARAAVRTLPRATAVNDADGDAIFDDLDASLTTTGVDERIGVIVVFRAGISGAEGARRVRAVAPDARLSHTFHLIPALAGALTPAEVVAVAALDEVRQIELDRVGAPELGTATQVMGADAAVDTLGISGDLDGVPSSVSATDVGVAVLDTGFHTSHQELADSKLVAWYDPASGASQPSDSNGHGTHVANIAVGWGASPQHRGVAPGASLIGVRISGGGDTASNAIAGYEWLVDHMAEFNIRVATISFGFGTATDGTSALELAVDATWDAGIVTFKSNGNGGPGNSTMTIPAAARGILAIGSLLDPFGAGGGSYGFTLSEFSSRGPTSDGRIKPDLTAPGDTISAADAPTTSGYVVLSGTSMASPFAAGTAALMIAADPSLAPDDVRELLFATAEDRGAEGADNDFGHGRIQVYEAVAAALAGAGHPVDGTPPDVPTQHTIGGEMEADVFTATFEVPEGAGAFPIGASILTDGTLLYAEILRPDGSAGMPARLAPVNTADRQHNYSFFPVQPGTYTLRVIATPGSTITADISHP